MWVIWNQPKIMNQLYVIRYIHLTPFLKNHQTIYFIFLVIVCIIIYMEPVLIIYMLYIIKKKIKRMWPLPILNFLISTICIGFFGQTFLFLLVFFDCDGDKSYISSKLKCREGNWFNFFWPFILLAILIHICISILANNLYYKNIFDKNNRDILTKLNSNPDKSLLFTKIVVIIIFIVDKPEDKRARWIALFILMVFTGINAYLNIHKIIRFNRLLYLLNIFFSLTTFIAYFTLFVGNIFKILGFNGSIYLFFIEVIIFFIFILSKKKDVNLTLTDYRTIINPDEYISYIFQYYQIIRHMDDSRHYTLLLKSYIETVEQTCTIKDCPLEEYLRNLEKGENTHYLLFRFLEILFKYGNSKFKHNPKLKNAYSMLLLKMNHKKQAKVILYSIKNEKTSFQTKYNLYRCRKILDKYTAKSNTYYFNYRNKEIEFRKLISETTTLYYEFWSLVYGTKFQYSDNFKKLFKIGSKIMELNKKIDIIYNMLIKEKTNNIETYKLYIEYVENILKDEEKYQNYEKIKDLIFSETVENEEKIYSNFKIDFLKYNHNISYILISGRQKDLGTIIDCSLNASTVFGYTKDEIIGKNLNIFIPEIFHQKHDIILSNQSYINNLRLFNDLYQKKEYKPTFTEGNFFSTFKSQFIKKLKLKVYLVKTEDNLVTFVVEIIVEIPYMSELVKNRAIPNSNFDERCCVLTNENFLIHSFTANCIEKLGFSYSFIKSSYSIIPYIKQFYEDYLCSINDINFNLNYHPNTQNDLLSLENSTKRTGKKIYGKTISNEERQKIKIDLINRKYSKKNQIIWKINRVINTDKTANDCDDNANEFMQSKISAFGTGYTFGCIKDGSEKQIEREFLMEVKKAIIDNCLVGYYFFFSKLNFSDTRNLISYSSTLDSQLSEKNNESKITTKYKFMIKPQQKIEKESNISSTIIHSSSSILKNNSNIKNNEKNNSFIPKKKKVKVSIDNNINSMDQNINNMNTFCCSSSPRKRKPSRLSITIDDNEDKNDDFIIDENFVPKSSYNFMLDLDSMSYILEKNKQISQLNSYLKSQAMTKIRKCQEYIYSIEKEKSILELSKSNSNDSDSYYSSDIGEDYETSDLEKNPSSISYSRKSSLNKFKSLKTTVIKKKKNTYIEKASSLTKTYTLNLLNEIKGFNREDQKNKTIIMSSNNVIPQQSKIFENEYTFDNYYKVDLSKITLFIYDFNRDMAVEAGDEEVILKIESIKKNSHTKNNIIDIGKDLNYPFVSFKKKKNKKKDKNEENNKETENDINQNIIKEEKSFERKIKEAITNKSEEESVKKLKFDMLILFITMLFFASLILFLNLDCYKNLKQILMIIKNIINIKYCNTLSIYYIRELTLLNFNISNLYGGVYYKFSGNDRNEFENFVKNSFEDLFYENQVSMTEIFSSNFAPSKATQKNLTDTILDAKYLIDNNIGTINLAIFANIIQYSVVFYNLASSFGSIEQNNPDLYNYIYNSFNNYRKTILLLYDKYNLELNIQKTMIGFGKYGISISTLIIIILGCYFVVQSFISGDKRRMNYIQVFYDINTNSIKDLISKCEKFLDKLNKRENRNLEDYIDENIEEKINLLKNKKMINPKGKTLKNHKLNKNQMILSLNTKIFIIAYLIFMVILYSFFPFFINYIYNICKKSIYYSEFFLRINKFHSSILDLFNVYREYLFDNQTAIQNMNSFEFLTQSELLSYETISDDVRTIQTFLQENIIINDEIAHLLTLNLCSYSLTGYFKTVEDCKEKVGNIINYDFLIITTNFIQKIRSLKNIVKYKYETENIKGNLTSYELDVWRTWNNDIQPDGTRNFEFKLNLFNNETLHSYVNIVFINIFVPYIDKYRKIILNQLSIEGYEFKIIIIFITIIFLLVLNFMFYLLPRVNYLSDFIYKTKNMLSLIPMTILTDQSNIKSLLKLN